MLTGIHILLTYKCNFACDHCFLYCSPQARGTFTLDFLREVLTDAARIGSVKLIYFEGGEPLLYYPLLREGIRIASELGFETGVVTNAYMAVSDADAELWLRPLAELGLNHLRISEDDYHYGCSDTTPSRRALAAAERLGLSVRALTTGKPGVETTTGTPALVSGGTMFKGRAAKHLTAGLPRRRWCELTTCPHEKLDDPGRVHIGPYGYVHLCQGLCLGNIHDRPLSELLREYDPVTHPICGPLLADGPARLAEAFGISPEDGYVDECHLCFLMRKALLTRFPEYLGPPQVYGVDES